MLVFVEFFWIPEYKFGEFWQNSRIENDQGVEIGERNPAVIIDSKTNRTYVNYEPGECILPYRAPTLKSNVMDQQIISRIIHHYVELEIVERLPLIKQL